MCVCQRCLARNFLLCGGYLTNRKEGKRKNQIFYRHFFKDVKITHTHTHTQKGDRVGSNVYEQS